MACSLVSSVQRVQQGRARLVWQAEQAWACFAGGRLSLLFLDKGIGAWCSFSRLRSFAPGPYPVCERGWSIPLDKYHGLSSSEPFDVTNIVAFCEVLRSRSAKIWVSASVVPEKSESVSPNEQRPIKRASHRRRHLALLLYNR